MKNTQVSLLSRNRHRVSLLRNTPTASELEFRLFLETLRVPFIFQKGFLRPFHRIVDFYIPKRFLNTGKGLAIEIDGPSHDDAEKDERRDQIYSESRKIEFFRLKDDEIFDGSYQQKTQDTLNAKLKNPIR